VSSLLYLESTTAAGQQASSILQECRDRVRSMALVHEALYRSENLAAVNFAEYAATVSRQLLVTYHDAGRSIRLTTDMDPLFLHLDLAVPCGLILNELVTNAIKHAFPASGGEVRLALRESGEGGWVLGVKDDGAGLPASFDEESTHSMGLRL